MSNEIADKRKKRFEWFATWLVIFFSGSAYAASNNTFYALFKYVITFCIGAFYLIRSRGKIPLVRDSKKMALWIPVIWGTLCFGNWIVHSEEGVILLISRLLHLVLAYEIVCIVSWDSFKEKYAKSIVYICAISLVFFLILDGTSLFSAIMPRLTGFTETGAAYTKYQGFLVYFKTRDHRNYGAFWEPGIFATHIICAFLMLPYIDLVKSKRKVMYAILAISLITTASSAGYVLLAIAFICNLISQLKIDKKRDYVKIVVVFVLFALLIIVYLNLATIIRMLSLDNNLVFEKMLHISESQRSDSIRVNLEAFLQKPIFGFGFSNIDQALSYKALGKSTAVVDTATTFRLLAAMGIGGAFFTLILIGGILRSKKLAWFVKIVMITIMMLIINKESHDSFLLAWCLAMYMNEKEYTLDTGGEE